MPRPAASLPRPLLHCQKYLAANGTGIIDTAGYVMQRSLYLRSSTTALTKKPRDWVDWLQRAVAGCAEQMQIMYGVAGERQLAEYELEHLPGYENSKARARRKRGQFSVSTRRLRRGYGCS